MPAPSRLGKYQIRREIGRGSMGVVYEGFDPQIERRVAVKVVRTDDLDPSQAPELLARLKREAQAAGRLSHPGIVAIYDYGEDTTLTGSAVTYIAMELVDGGDLKALLDDGHRFAIADVARLMRSLLDALQHAHERGVTHRDVKPGNVMLRPDGSVKIADFGIAHLENSDLTRAGTVVGTPLYMAPEQLLGLRVDGRADLFACGVILYQLLTGARPFTGSYATVVQKVLNEDPPPPTTLNHALVPAWDMVVRKAMAKKPEQRYASAAEFIAAIERAASSSPDESTVALPLSEGAPPTSALPATPMASSASTRRAKRAMAAGAALVVAAGIAVIALRPTSSPPAAASAASSPAAARPIAPATHSAAATSSPSIAPRTIEVPASETSKPVEAAAPPAPSPAPRAALATTASVDEWRARRLALDTPAARASLTGALSALLDIRRDEDRWRITDFETQLRMQPPHWALAFGVADGHTVPAWRIRPSAAEAAEASLRRCRELRAIACAVAVIDGEFRTASVAEFGAALGERSVAEVRGGLLRTLERASAGLRLAPAPLVSAPASVPAGRSAAAPPAGRPAAPPVARAPAIQSEPAAPSPDVPGKPPTAPPAPLPVGAAGSTHAAPVAAMPAREWSDARAALRAAEGRLSLAKALAILLGARAGHETDTLERFEATFRRLQWKSALALGERDGYVQWGWRSRESNQVWAAEGALAGCNRVSSAPCLVVIAEGKFDEAAFLDFAARLGARPRAVVLDATVKAMHRRLEAGGL